MRIGLVTMPPRTKGGGGRELFLSILVDLASRHEVTVITNGRYNQFDMELPLIVENVDISEGLEERKFEFIIFDTEYSFRSFINFLPELRQNSLNLVALFHDEYWKKSPLILYRRGVFSFRESVNLDYFKSLVYCLVEGSLIRKNISGKVKLLIKGLAKSYRRDILDNMSFLDTISVLGAESKSIWEKSIKVFGFKTEVVFNPILFSTIKTDKMELVDMRDSTPFFVLHSRIAIEKNIEFVLRVFEGFADSYRLKIVGRVHDKEYFEELKKLIEQRGLESAVVFHLDADSMSLQSFLSTAKLYICADLADFNIATVKALFLGCPCVVHSTFTKLPENLLDMEPRIFRSRLSIVSYRRQVQRAIEAGRFDRAKNTHNISNYTRKLINDD